MTTYGEFDSDSAVYGSSLTPAEKAAAVLLAMGKPVAGKLLKFFEYEELQGIIKNAQNLRTIKPQELIELVNEFEDLFSEGAGLMDNAKAMEGILEEGLTPDEVDGLLGRRAQFDNYETSIWDRLQDSDPDRVGQFLQAEHPQTAAYIVSMLPTAFAGKTLMRLPEKIRVDIVRRAVDLKNVNPRAAAATRALGRTVGVEIDVVLTDLLRSMRVDGAIDVLCFNPPYVPTPSEEIEPIRARGNGIAAAWAGGLDGREVIDRFLPFLPRVLSERGCCYLLLVQKNKPFQLIRALSAMGLASKIVVKRRAQNERLLVLRIFRAP